MSEQTPETPANSAAPEQSSDKATSKAAFAYAGSESDLGFDNPLLEKIRKLLTSTDPEKWMVGGEDLTPTLRFPRPRPAYEQVLVRDIPNGSLCLHLVQPIQCHYGPGGYSITPHGAAIYTIEVRDRVFDATKLVDPKFAANFLGKRCDVVAGGDIAKSLYIQVKQTILSFCKEKKKEFDEACDSLLPEILDRVEKSNFSDWKKSSEVVEEERTITYASELQGLLVEVKKITKGFEDAFKVLVSKDAFTSNKVPQSTARLCFKKIEDLEQNSQLEKLGEVLKDLGFE
jgi:hypothetical protein